MNGRTLRFVLASLLAILGACWFAVDFSSSHPAAPDAVVVAGAGADLPAVSAAIADEPTRYPWSPRAAFGTMLAGGAISDLPFGTVLATAGLYLVGRLSFKRWSARR